MRNRLTALIVLALTVGVAQPAAAQVIDRVQVGVPGTATRTFPENLSVVLSAPENFNRDCCYDFVSGAWTGPRYRADGRDFQNASRIDWSVEFARTSTSRATLARAAGWRRYPEAAAEARKVRHIVGGRAVGTLKAFSAVDAQPAPGAKVQAAMVIDLGKRVKAITVFDLTDPPADQSSAGALTVEGQPASVWNRRQADVALDRLYVEGPLPPRKVKVRAAGKRVTGSVVDSFGHPVGEALVRLQRRAGGGWRPVAKANANTRGKFSLAARGAGQYRVVAALAKTTVRSKPVRVR